MVGVEKGGLAQWESAERAYISPGKHRHQRLDHHTTNERFIEHL